jgi:paraquat-inducible protein B
MMLVLHDDTERDYAYGPANGLPDTKVGTFSRGLADEAKKKGWTNISMPAQLEALEASVTTVLDKLAALPLPDLIADLRRTVQGLDGLVTSPDTKQAVAALSQAAVRLDALIGTLDQRLAPLLIQAQSTLAAADGLVGANAPLRYDLNALLKELTGAARSIRVFADYLERHPDALLRGKVGVQ